MVHYKILFSSLILIALISCNKKYPTQKKNNLIIQKTRLKKSTKKLDDLFSVTLLKTNRDTLVDFNFLERDFVVSTQIQFNYPVLENKFLKKGELVLQNDTIELRIKETDFNKSNHQLTFQKYSGISQKNKLSKIDGKAFYGSDGEIPKTEIEFIKGRYKNSEFEINKNQFNQFYDANFTLNSVKVYVLEHEKLIITFWGSDGAGAYFAVLFLNQGKIERSIVNFGF